MDVTNIELLWEGKGFLGRVTKSHKSNLNVTTAVLKIDALKTLLGSLISLDSPPGQSHSLP